jgi:hypothetical protein
LQTSKTHSQDISSKTAATRTITESNNFVVANRLRRGNLCFVTTKKIIINKINNIFLFSINGLLRQSLHSLLAMMESFFEYIASLATPNRYTHYNNRKMPLN